MGVDNYLAEMAVIGVALLAVCGAGWHHVIIFNYFDLYSTNR